MKKLLKKQKRLSDRLRKEKPKRKASNRIKQGMFQREIQWLRAPVV